MFKDIVATGAYAFSSTTNPRHYGGSEAFPSADNLEERSDESEDPVCQPNPQKSLNNNNKNPLDINNFPKFKKAGGRSKVSGAAKLASQIERLVKATEERSDTVYVVRKEMPGTSIAEVVEVVMSLPGIVIGDPTWLFATKLFQSREKREMFATMKDPHIQSCWLTYEYGLLYGSNPGAAPNISRV